MRFQKEARISGETLEQKVMERLRLVRERKYNEYSSGKSAPKTRINKSAGNGRHK